ncbi:hypothetical protein ACNRBH_00740 [Ralstonia pseudosolanacearum]|uniref:hypothetical protein n=1 Tax=Ralstonia pseudosolanacearum TaxID=1310165 RepID=UPI003AAE6F4A
MEINVGKIKISISKRSESQIPPDKLLFDRLHLDGLLRPYFDSKSSLTGILLSQLSIIATIGLTFLVSDVNTKWGIEKSLWVFIITSTFALLTAWSLFVFYKIIRSPSFDDFQQKIISHSLTIQDRRFVFLLFARDSKGERRILVQYSNEWNCWLLPNFGKSESSALDSHESLRGKLTAKLSAEIDDIALFAVNEDLISTKTSFKSNKITSYYFDFYLVKIVSETLSTKMICQQFELAGGSFAWMTIGELRKDPLTRERNGDVIDHLESKIMANGSSTLAMAQSVNCA